MELPFIIILSLLLLIFLILLLIAYILHNKVFANRYTPDPLVTYYTKDEFHLNSTNVEIPVGKQILRGALYYYDNHINDKIIIFSHGMWSSTKAYIQDIAYLCNAGYMVLGFDYEGTDLSTGKSIKGLSNGLKSLDYAIRYIKKNYKDKDIYVIGHSWGAYNTINATKYHKDIKKIVAMAPFVSLAKVFKGMLPKKTHILIPFLIIVEYLKCGKYALVNSLKSLNRYKGCTYILHSKNDHTINYNKSTLFIKNNTKNTNIKYNIVDNKFHNPNYSDSAIESMVAYVNSLSGKTKEEIIEIKRNTDFHKLGELDNKIMDDIVEFLKNNT